MLRTTACAHLLTTGLASILGCPCRTPLAALTAIRMAVVRARLPLGTAVWRAPHWASMRHGLLPAHAHMQNGGMASIHDCPCCAPLHAGLWNLHTSQRAGINPWMPIASTTARAHGRNNGLASILGCPGHTPLASALVWVGGVGVASGGCGGGRSRRSVSVAYLCVIVWYLF